MTQGSVQFTQSCLTLWPHGLQHARPPCPSPTPGVYSSSCPLNWWCHPSISFSVIPFSSHLQPLPASGSFPVSQIFASGGQSIRVSASSLVLPMSIQDWFPLGSPCCPRDSQESFPTPQNFEHHSSKASIKDTRINSCYIKYCQVGLVLAPPHPFIHLWKICPR